MTKGTDDCTRPSIPGIQQPAGIPVTATGISISPRRRGVRQITPSLCYSRMLNKATSDGQGRFPVMEPNPRRSALGLCRRPVPRSIRVVRPSTYLKAISGEPNGSAPASSLLRARPAGLLRRSLYGPPSRCCSAASCAAVRGSGISALTHSSDITSCTRMSVFLANRTRLSEGPVSPEKTTEPASVSNR